MKSSLAYYLISRNLEDSVELIAGWNTVFSKNYRTSPSIWSIIILMSCTLRRICLIIFFYTIMNVKGKTKDNPKVREDMKNICKHPLLELVEVSSKKVLKLKASYTLTREQLKDVCEWCKNLKFSYGYASNLARCINIKYYYFYGLKSHDCYIFM